MAATKKINLQKVRYNRPLTNETQYKKDSATQSKLIRIDFDELCISYSRFHR